MTPPPYTNKKDYKGGTNDKTRDSHTHETSDSPSDTDSCARKLYEKYIMKKMKITLSLNLKKKSKWFEITGRNQE